MHAASEGIMSEAVKVTCPHCGSQLEVDSEAGVVVGHTPPVVQREKVDFDAKLKEMEEQKRRASDRMAEAMRKEKSKERIMEDRFRKLMDEAKDSEDDQPPVRDIDLD
jgi:hypothetical protein